MFINLWDVKEPAHLLQRVGHVVPDVVVCLLWYIMVGRVKRAYLIWSLALLRNIGKNSSEAIATVCM